jgi:DMSO reductase anchor subunit
MLVTLPLVLFIVLTELSIGSVVMLVLLDWRNEVKRGFLTSYAAIYLVLVGLAYLFQQNFSTPQLLNTFTQLDRGWTPYLSLPLLLFFLLMIPYNVLLWLDKQAGIDGKKSAQAVEGQHAGDEQAAPETATTKKGLSVLRLLRIINGVALLLAGLTTLFVMGMIYRPLADANLGGVFTVAGFFASALALGGVMTAMWLGHWYLVTPALSEKPLQFATTLVLVGVLAQLIFSFTAGPVIAASAQATQGSSTAITTSTPTIQAATPTPGKPQLNALGTPLVTPLSVSALGWLRILVSFVLPLVLGALAWKLIRDRSFQSATGMLYLVVVCSLAGEAIARGLLLVVL